MAAKHATEWHLESRTPLYKLWINVKDRVGNPANPYFHNYGGRGVTLHPEWGASFLAFKAGVGPRPSPQHTLDRIKNERGYEPGNVKWATKREQANNQRKNVRLTVKGETATLAEWARRTGLRPSALHYRINQGGMTHEEAVMTPSRGGRPKARSPAQQPNRAPSKTQQ